MPSFDFTSQRPLALTQSGLLTEITEGVDLNVPVAASSVVISPPVVGLAATDVQAALSELVAADTGKQPLDADLTAIAGLAGTTGFLKKTAADTWTLDTNTYITTTNLKDTPNLAFDVTNNTLVISALGTGSGRERLKLVNTDTSSGSACLFSLYSGATTANYMQFVQYGTEYTTIPALTGKSAFQAINTTMVLRTTGPNTDIEFWTAGVLKMTLNAAGELVFHGAASRIIGLMDGSPRANRLAFQTSTPNGTTNLAVIPNGAGVQSVVTAFSSSDPDNSVFLQMLASTSFVAFQGNISGTGTAVPMYLRANPASHCIIIDPATNIVTFHTAPNLTVPMTYANTPVVGARKTGWGAPTATLKRTALTNASTATDVLQTLAALITDITTHGLIGA